MADAGDSGRSPGYSSKLNLALERGMRADAAVKVVLRRLLQTLLENLEGTRRAADEECLHDFRVAVRRARSCLGQIKKVLPSAETRPFRRELSWLGKATGPLRDLDVLLLELPGYAEESAESDLGCLAPLTDFLRQRQREEQQRIVELLDSDRFHLLVDLWRGIAERGEPPHDLPRRATDPIGRLAACRIARAFARVLDRGREIDARSEAARLHRLRIECKKLRYLLEFFRSLSDPQDLEPVVRSLKRLQDCLGTFNDLAVHRELLCDVATQMADSGRLTDATARTIEKLGERLARRQDQQRAKFERRFGAFDDRRTHERMRRITQAGDRTPPTSEESAAPEDRDE